VSVNRPDNKAVRGENSMVAVDFYEIILVLGDFIEGKVAQMLDYYY